LFIIFNFRKNFSISADLFVATSIKRSYSGSTGSVVFIFLVIVLIGFILEIFVEYNPFRESNQSFYLSTLIEQLIMHRNVKLELLYIGLIKANILAKFLEQYSLIDGQQKTFGFDSIGRVAEFERNSR
jgi:hypothetical protein